MIIRTQTLQLARRLSTPSVIRMSSTFPSDLKPRFSPGEDVSQVERGVESLMIKGWGLDEERMGVKKTYYFKSYFKAVVC